MNKELKQKYKKDFVVLRELINSFDPCGLIGGGAPKDEYDYLTQQLISFIYNKKTRQEIKELIIYEIELHFGTPDLTTLSKKKKAKFDGDVEQMLNNIEKYFGNPETTKL